MPKVKPVAAGAAPLAALPEIETHADEPMTPKQAAILRELCERKGEPFDGALTRRQAEERIAYLDDAG